MSSRFAVLTSLAPSGRPIHSDRLVLAALLALSAALRLVSLPDRGAWDADQGRDLLVLRSLVVDGALPLVGPATSVGGVHHGAAYYYLLAPLAWLGGLDPGVIAGLFAAAGIALVGLTWWLARSIGGSLAGTVAGLLVALSPTAIASSVTIWNPNLVAPVAALTLGAAWRAWTSRDARWWVLALAALGLTTQLHVVAAVLAVPVLALLVADARRSPPGQRSRLARSVAAGGAIVLVMFVPLIVHELGTGFSELRAGAAFLVGGGGPSSLDPLARLAVTIARMASWPIVGLVVDAPLAASLVTLLVVAVAVALWQWRARRGEPGTGTRWVVGTLAWSAVAVTFAAPGLATVVRGLPNDHYHAFTDPVVPVLLGLGAAALASVRLGLPAGRPVGQVLAAILVAGLVVTEVLRFPPLRDPDGGWAAARSAAERVVRTTGDRALLVVGLPRFKAADGFVFPLRVLGRFVVDGTGAPGGAADTPTLGGLGKVSGIVASTAGALVVICDRLFEPVLGATCGGSAEQVVEREQPGYGKLADRFDLSGRTSVSVYLPTPGGG